MLLSAKREDTTPKEKRKIRGMNGGRGIAAARSRGTDTSNLSAAEMAQVISPDKPLTDKQKLFVKFWAEGESIMSASTRAGYADGGTIAYRMVKMPNILALKSRYEAKYEADAQMTRKKVMDGLLEAIDMAKLLADPTAMISGWREVAKMCGYMEPVKHRVDVNVTGNITMDRINRLSDAELLKMIEQGAPVALSAPDNLGDSE